MKTYPVTLDGNTVGSVTSEETGLYYIQTRYYSSNMSRFICADSEVGKLQMLAHNLFAYCLNASPSRVDSSGRASYAIGSVFSGSFGAAASFASGYCWDDEGNFGVYYTFVGIDHDINQMIENTTIGLGGISASMGLTYQVFPNKSIKDIVGSGTYYGFGGDAWGYSFGVDGINTISSSETFADTVRDNRPADSYQYSINLGVGYELAHAGTSNTYIMLIVENGKYIPLWKRKLVNVFPAQK